MSLASFLLVLRARWRPIALCTGLALLLALAYALWAPRTYTASTQLLVDSKAQDPISGQLLPAHMNTGYLATQAEVVASQSVALKVLALLSAEERAQLEQELGRTSSAEPSADQLLSLLHQRLSVTSARESNLLNLGFSAQNPQLAATIANRFAEAFIQANLELRIAPAKQISQWYAQQLAELRASLVDKQNALLAYQQEHGLVVNADKLDLEQAKLSRLSALLTEAQSQRLTNQNLSQQLGNSKQKLLTSQAQDNPQVQKLSTELLQAQAKLKDLALRVGENHPQYRQAQTEVEGLQKQLNRTLELLSGSVKSSVALAQSREIQLAAEVATQKDLVLQLNRNRNQLALLQQEVDSAQSAYDSALARSSQTQLESRIAQTDVAVLNQATPPKRPTSPKRLLVLVLALATGLCSGLALALGWEWLDRPVRSSDDLTQQLGLAVLASIPVRSLPKPALALRAGR